MKAYYDAIGRNVFDRLPTTYHILKDDGGVTLSAFTEEYNANGGVWIVKPGENSNRGCGINVYSEYEEIKSKVLTGRSKTYIVQ
jgi:tubulin--tyrosine ligase